MCKHKQDMVQQYISSDYAGMDCGNLTFYYGYEHKKDDEDAFIVTENGIEVMRLSETEVMQQSKDSHGGLDECFTFLLAGIGIYLEQLTFKPLRK